MKGRRKYRQQRKQGLHKPGTAAQTLGKLSRRNRGRWQSVLDTVGKLCRDIDPIQAHAPHNNDVRPAAAVKLTDPTQAHASDSIETQPAKSVRTDPQAAAMLAENAGRARAGSSGWIAGGHFPDSKHEAPR